MEVSVRRLKRYWKDMGPGLVTGAADDDPEGVAAYSQTGAQFGFQYLWLALVTFPLMSVVQEMCARIGLVTGRGLAENIRREYSKPALWTVVALLVFANTLNIGADLVAMADAAKLLVPAVPVAPVVVFFALVSLVLQVFIPYSVYAQHLKYLTFALFAYIITAFLIGLDWPAVLRGAFIPSIPLSGEAIIVLCAVLGTTISPYLFFWQASQEVEEEIDHGRATIEDREGASAVDIQKMRVDVWSGMFVSNVVMFFIIAVCAGTLYAHGVTDIRNAADAAAALKPFAGRWAELLFAAGIIGTGFLGVPVLAGASAYAVAETMHWHEGLYNTLREAYGFYGVIACSMLVALFIGTFGIDPMKALLYSAVFNGLVAPVMIFFIVHLSSDMAIMGDWVSGPVTRVSGWLIVATMALVGVASIWVMLA
ncbi:divalent metal cation transporter [Candidatus Kaiserbacteria bacterium]|nr:divalent metal cation transporter [Candidatus Kaiserbacteria bacterium]